MTKKVALVAGASGLVGTRLAEALVNAGDWHVIGGARRIPANRAAGVDYIAVDLTDPALCRHAARGLHGVTHLFYTARHPFVTGQPEDTIANTAMFRNLLDALEEANHPLQHVHLVHGTKYYGVTLGRHPTPAREDDPRCLLSNFYYEQEDIVRARATAGGWSWTVTRPHCICDASLATPRSLPLIIATFAAISKHLGQPLCFPGTMGNYRALYQCTDAQLLARAILWMATERRCANEPFNVSNGDVFRWENVWPQIARYFGMELGPVRTLSLAELMPDYAPVWRDIVARHKLVDTPYENMALWSYGDVVFTPDWDIMSSTTKLHQYGFHEVIDTPQMLFAQFDGFRRAKVIPAT
jgi:nucleoside-diphosphate-sugar epimerase